MLAAGSAPRKARVQFSPYATFEVTAMPRWCIGTRYGAIGSCCLLLLLADPTLAEFKLLDQLEDTRIEPIGRFVAAEAFKVGTRIGGRTLSAVGLNFSQHFLGVVEKDVAAV